MDKTDALKKSRNENGAEMPINIFTLQQKA